MTTTNAEFSRHDWQPSCAHAVLETRARLLGRIRDYFRQNGVLEVETPILGQAIGTDPQLAFFITKAQGMGEAGTLYLQTSPEFAMKRLLAAGSGSIYQIGKAFRNNETGRFHNPEFTLLEWYRVGYDLEALMDDCESLIATVFAGHRSLLAPQRFSYCSLFAQYTGLDASRFDSTEYRRFAAANEFPEAAEICGEDHAIWLDFLFSHCIQPNLGADHLCLVYGYPACQAALAQLNENNPLIAERVELFIDGLELGNGYFELTDANEQSTRFEREQELRRQLGLPLVNIDYRLLSALAAGLPECAGMAIGIDRLLMVLLKKQSLDDVLAFPVGRA